jgi:hypothetical protein
MLLGLGDSKLSGVMKMLNESHTESEVAEDLSTNKGDF